MKKKDIVKFVLEDKFFDSKDYSYILSQEEIDAILKEQEENAKKAADEQLDFFGYIPVEIKTREELEKLYPPKDCEHHWEMYTGLNVVEEYCTKCNKTRRK